MSSSHGERELAYFLSRRPESKTIGCWTYNPYIDSWEHPDHGRMKVRMELSKSVTICLGLGLTHEDIEKFISRQMEP